MHAGVRRSCGRLALTLAPLVLWGGPATAQGLESEAAFLTIPSGAAVVALGRAATSLPDSRAGFYNPAAAAWVDRPVFGLSRYDGPLGFLAHRGTAAVPVASIAVVHVAAQVQTFGEFALDDEMGGAGSFEPQNVITEVGVTRAIGRVLALGARGKWVDSRITGRTASRTVALDLGLLLAVPAAPVMLGVALLDAGSELGSGASGAGEAPLPTRLRLGASGSVPLARDLQLLVAADAAAPPRAWRTLSRYAGVGLEYRDLIALRAGLLAEKLIETNTGATFGIGFRFGGVELDFARELGANRLGDETHISLGFRP